MPTSFQPDKTRPVIPEGAWQAVFASLHGSIGRATQPALGQFIAGYPKAEGPWYLVKWADVGDYLSQERIEELTAAQANGYRVMVQTKGPEGDPVDPNKADALYLGGGLDIPLMEKVVTACLRAGIKPDGLLLSNETDLQKHLRQGHRPAKWAKMVENLLRLVEDSGLDVGVYAGAFSNWQRPLWWCQELSPYAKRNLAGVVVHNYQSSPYLPWAYDVPGKIREVMSRGEDLEIINGESALAFVSHPPHIPRKPENERAAYEIASRLTHAYMGVPYCRFNLQDEEWQSSKVEPGTNRTTYWTPEPYEAEGMWERPSLGGGIRASGRAHTELLHFCEGDLMHLTRDTPDDSLYAGLFVSPTKSQLLLCNAPTDPEKDYTWVRNFYTEGQLNLVPSEVPDATEEADAENVRDRMFETTHTITLPRAARILQARTFQGATVSGQTLTLPPHSALLVDLSNVLV